MAALPSRGEIWTAELDPVRGHEQAGTRPVLIVSTNLFNHGPARQVVVVPLTRTGRGIPLHVAIEPPEGGLTARSYALCDAVRAIARERIGRRWGVVSAATMDSVADRLRVLMEL